MGNIQLLGLFDNVTNLTNLFGFQKKSREFIDILFPFSPGFAGFPLDREKELTEIEFPCLLHHLFFFLSFCNILLLASIRMHYAYLT